MKGKSTVDILCPCYNGARFLEQLIATLLAQTYDNINIIVANDESTDNSPMMLEAFRTRVEKRGYGYVILHQKNGGLASAYNCCLTVSTADYRLQIDFDDRLTPDAIEKYVHALDENPHIGFVRANGWEHYLDSNKTDIEFLDKPWISRAVQHESKLYIPILLNQAYLALPHSYMFCRSCFEEIYPDNQIDESRLGQNYQVLLALAYRFKGIFIDEPLFYYTIRNDSMEHTAISSEKELWRIEESARLIKSVLKTAGAPDALGEKYAGIREYRLKLSYDYKYKNKRLSRTVFRELAEYTK